MVRYFKIKEYFGSEKRRTILEARYLLEAGRITNSLHFVDMAAIVKINRFLKSIGKGKPKIDSGKVSSLVV